MALTRTARAQLVAALGCLELAACSRHPAAAEQTQCDAGRVERSDAGDTGEAFDAGDRGGAATAPNAKDCESDGGARDASTDARTDAGMDAGIDAQPSALEEVRVRVGVTSYDTAQGSVGEEVRVTINEGRDEGRVQGLQVFADGMEVDESSSAAFPPAWSFQHYPVDPEHGQTVSLEFQYDKLSFSTSVSPLVVDFQSPAEGSALSIGDTVVVRWSGVAQQPASLRFTRAGCAVRFVTESMDATEARFAVMESETGTAPPCEVAVEGEWSLLPELIDPSPFAELSVTRAVRRIQTFVIE